MFKKLITIGFLLVIITHLAGCGETVTGIGKDIKRVGQGVKTIFLRDGS